MRKDVVVTIVQKPVEIVFTCIHCDEEFEIDYKEFENMINNDLSGILYDNPNFDCPNCNGALCVGQAYLD